MMSKKMILVIDDDPTVLHLLEKKLSETGDYDVVTAREGKTGLAAARRIRPDLILLDVMIPDKSGGEIAAELSRDEKTKHIPVIFISVLLDSAGKKRIEVNEQEYRAVAKPVYFPALLSQIRRAVNEVNSS